MSGKGWSLQTNCPGEPLRRVAPHRQPSILPAIRILYPDRIRSGHKSCPLRRRPREGGDPSIGRSVHCFYMDSRFRGNDVREALDRSVPWQRGKFRMRRRGLAK